MSARLALALNVAMKEGRNECLTGDSVSVVETFNDFGAEVVYRIGNVEAVRVEEGFVGRVHTGGVPAEYLGSDSCEGRVVQIVTAIDEREPKVNVILSVEDRTSKEKVPAVKAC